jgi:hypothetical protein
MNNNPEKGLNYQLNIHGYAFQYAAIKIAQEVSNEKKSPWIFDVSEFPVEINNSSTHIDFILRSIREPFLMVVECKRVNPAISNWCFVKAPYVSRKPTEYNMITREVLVSRESSGDPPIAKIDSIYKSDDIYRLSFEVKSGEKGEGSQGRGQINSAITQVLRGQNGLINYYAEKLVNSSMMPLGKNYNRNDYVAFMPVIFTTANLWVSDVDLSKADIVNGNIDLSTNNLKKTDWVFYQYSQTPDLSHSLSGKSDAKNLSESLIVDFSRTIPIVNASSIAKFLSIYLWKDSSEWVRYQ